MAATLDDIRAALDKAKAKQLAKPPTSSSTAIVVRDPLAPDPPPGPRKPMAPWAEVAVGAIGGATLGKSADKFLSQSLGVNRPGLGSMLVGMLSTMAGGLVSDPALAITLKNIGLGAAAVGAAKAAANFKPEPEPLIEEAKLAMAYQNGQRKKRSKRRRKGKRRP